VSQHAYVVALDVILLGGWIARSDFGSFMERREFITLVGGMAATWPFAARAQQLPPMPLVGFMHILSHENVPHFMPAFREGLLEQGFVEGRNVAIEYRWAEGHYDRLQSHAADLVRLSGGDRSNGWSAFTAGGYGGHANHPDRIHDQWRPGDGRLGR
jgi:hypothetical protein